LVLGVANRRSLAWAITQVLDQARAKRALTYQNERTKHDVEASAPPLRRNITHEEVAKAALFLLSDLPAGSPARSSTSMRGIRSWACSWPEFPDLRP